MNKDYFDLFVSRALGAQIIAVLSSSLECSAERSRKSTKLKLVCEYRTAGLPVKRGRGSFRKNPITI